MMKFSSSLPKHENLPLPALSPTMTKGTIMEWKKKQGDRVKAGQVIAEIETDKAAVGFEVQEDCYIAKILYPAGSQDIQVGTTVVITVSKPDLVAAFQNYSPSASTTQTTSSAPSTSSNSAPAPQAAATPAPSSPAPSSSSQIYPKHQILSMPALSPTMEQGKIFKWTKNVGDQVKAGENLAQVETDQSSVGFEYQDDDGYVAKILVQAGTELSVGTPVIVLVQKPELVKEFADFSISGSSASQPSAESSSSSNSSSSAPQPSSPVSTTSNNGGRVFASPLAKVLANDKGVPLQNIQGSGPNNRVIKSDVENYVASSSSSAKTTQTATASTTTEAKPVETTGAAKPAAKKPTLPEANPVQELEVTNMRRVIAQRLLQSKRDIPHYYLNISVQVDALLALRGELNKDSKHQISVNDFIVKACALALRDVPDVNSQWHGKVIQQFQNADISIAVATDTGLITPIVFNAAAQGLSEIADNTQTLAQKAKENQLQPHEFMGGTFSISNLGMMGIDNFCAVINPPQSAILAVGSTAQRLVPSEDGAKEPYRIASVMEVTLSCDHRVIDGAVGAKWLGRFQAYLERPTLMLL